MEIAAMKFGVVHYMKDLEEEFAVFLIDKTWTSGPVVRNEYGEPVMKFTGTRLTALEKMARPGTFHVFLNSIDNLRESA
jgi:hypothetical protein